MIRCFSIPDSARIPMRDFLDPGKINVLSCNKLSGISEIQLVSKMLSNRVSLINNEQTTRQPNTRTLPEQAYIKYVCVRVLQCLSLTWPVQAAAAEQLRFLQENLLCPRAFDCLLFYPLSTMQLMLELCPRRQIQFQRHQPASKQR